MYISINRAERHKWQKQCTGSPTFPSSGTGHCNPLLSCSVSKMLPKVTKDYADRLTVAGYLPRGFRFQINLQRSGSLRHNGGPISFMKVITWAKEK